MLFLPKLDADEMFRLMPQATVMMGVPTFYTRLLADARLTRETTRHMRLFVSGSAPLLAETHREWQARTGHAILERYGMTETNMNTSNPYRRRAHRRHGGPAPAGGGDPHRRSGERHAVAAGRDRHDRSARPQCVQRLLADAGKNPRRIPRRRLFHHRRSGDDRRPTAMSRSSGAARIW